MTSILGLMLALLTPAAAQDTSPVSGWFRVDTDGLGTQLWAGGTYGEGAAAFAADIYVVGSFAELDVGPCFTVGDLSLLPMVGLGFDFAEQRAATLVAPQLFTIYDGPLYFESWVQVFLNDLFIPDTGDSLYSRHFLLTGLGSHLQVGPQAEPIIGLSEAAGSGLISSAVGGRVNASLLNDWQATVGVFLGYELVSENRDNQGLSGRFTFVVNL